MLDDRSDTGAARGDDLLLQAVGVEAAALLPPQHQDLLLDGHGVEAVVLLPQGAHTAGQAAPGIGDHPREAVGIVIQAGDEDTRLIYAPGQRGLAGSSCLYLHHPIYLCILTMRHKGFPCPQHFQNDFLGMESALGG